MDPQNNQNPTPVADPMGSPVADPNAGVQVPQAEPSMPVAPPAMPVEPVAPAVPEPVAPVMPEPQAPVEPVMPTDGTGDAGTGMPPTTPPAAI